MTDYRDDDEAPDPPLELQIYSLGGGRTRVAARGVGWVNYLRQFSPVTGWSLTVETTTIQDPEAVRRVTARWREIEG